MSFKTENDHEKLYEVRLKSVSVFEGMSDDHIIQIYKTVELVNTPLPSFPIHRINV